MEAKAPRKGGQRKRDWTVFNAPMGKELRSEMLASAPIRTITRTLGTIRRLASQAALVSECAKETSVNAPRAMPRGPFVRPKKAAT